MGTTIELGKTSTKSGFNLFWGVAMSSIISALGVIVVARILSPSEYGLYAIVLIAPKLVEIIRDLGVDQAVINYTAKYNSENKPEKIKNIIWTATAVELILGAILSGILFLLSEFIGSSILDRPEITPLIQISSLTIIGSAVTKVAQSAFIGYEKMEFQSITLVVDALLKAVLMILLVSLGLGIYGAIIGNTVGYIITGLTSAILLYFKVYKKIHPTKHEKNKVWTNFKEMFRYGLPLSLSTTIIEIKIQFFSFLTAIYLVDQVIGNYQAAKNFSVLLAFFVTPVQTILFPTFSKIDAKKEPNVLRNVFRFSVKYGSLLIIPTTLLVIVLSKPAVFTVFGEKYELTPLYLALYLTGYLYTALGSQSIDNLIKSQGRTDVNLKLNLLTNLLGISLSLFLIPNFGILGLIFTTQIAIIPSLVISLWWIKKNFNILIEWKSSAKIITASAAAALVTYICINQLYVSSWITLCIGAAIYLITFIITAPLIGAIDRQDIKNLKEMIKALGPLAKILDKALNVVDKIIAVFQKKE